MTATVRGISVEGRGGSIDEEGRIEYRAVYKVGTDDRSDGPQTVGSAFGIPALGDQFTIGNDYDPRAIVVGKTVSQGDSPYEWLVEVTWSTEAKDDPASNKDPASTPLDEPAEITYGFQTRRIRVPGWFNDPFNPPNNKAWEQGIFAPNGELFDPQPEMEISEPVLTIQRNQPTINAGALMALANAVNSNSFYGAEARQLKMNAPQATRRFDKAIGFYWQVTYGMAFRWETWDIQILNMGNYYWDAPGKPADTWSSTRPRQVKKDIMGNVIQVNLSSCGKINTTGIPTFTRLRVFREIDFNGLGLV